MGRGGRDSTFEVGTLFFLYAFFIVMSDCTPYDHVLLIESFFSLCIYFRQHILRSLLSHGTPLKVGCDFELILQVADPYLLLTSVASFSMSLKSSFCRLRASLSSRNILAAFW